MISARQQRLQWGLTFSQVVWLLGLLDSASQTNVSFTWKRINRSCLLASARIQIHPQNFFGKTTTQGEESLPTLIKEKETLNQKSRGPPPPHSYGTDRVGGDLEV
eukprot:1138562-Pelagomonas_calceolata.AAC.2